MLDGILTLSQPFFMMGSTVYAYWPGLILIGPFIPIFLNTIVPVQIWSIIGVGQYLIPIIVLLQIKVPRKSWLYLIIYPIFMYSWIPVNFLGSRIGIR